MRILLLLLLILVPFLVEAQAPFLRKASVHTVLPLTVQENLTNCEDLIDYKKQFEKAVKCIDKRFLKFSHGPIPIPRCVVVGEDSPDLQLDLFNYFSLTPIADTQAVGFFEPDNNTLYVASNYDLDQIVRHEIQHWVLSYLGLGGDAAHATKVWTKCEPALYIPSKAALASSLVKFLTKQGIDIQDIDIEKSLKRLETKKRQRYD